MSYLQYVNPLQGTDSSYYFSKGITLPLTARPWGTAAWSPQSNEQGLGWFFHPDHRRFQGMRLTHQPSPWIRDYSSLVIMPQTGALALEANARSASYRPDQMVIKPHYFKLELPRYDTKIELVPAMRSAIMKTTFQSSEDARFIIDSFEGASTIEIDCQQRRITGSTSAHYGNTHQSFAMYYVIEFDCEIDADRSGIFAQDYVPQEVLQGTGNALGGFVGVQVPSTGEVNLRIAASFISLEQAQTNMELELVDFDLAGLKQEAEMQWEQLLSTIEIETASTNHKKTFYSALYRLCLFPRTMHEINTAGEQIHYSAYDGNIHAGPMYSDVGFWDIYRTSLPLYSLLFPSKLAEMTEAWVNIYKESGWMPKWISPAERSAMPGTLIDAAIADAYVKGICNFDIETAYEGLKKHAMNSAGDGIHGRKGLDEYVKYGYLPSNLYHESVSNALDYYYGDFCIAQIAKGLDKHADYEYLMERAKQYPLLFDAETGFMRARNEAGQFETSFDPLAWGGAYCEGGPWQCSWAVSHDIAGVAALMGGHEQLINKLDELFAMPPQFKVGEYGFEIHEMSEMAAVDFGQFAISNQPSFHIPYMYTVLGQPAKAQFWIHKAVQHLFTAEADGFPGDEDNGSLSAWYIWSVLGLYPFTPGVPQYIFGAPQFDRAVIHLENGKQLEIIAANNEAGHIYYEQLTINAEPCDKLYITHERLIEGGKLIFHKSPLPSEATINEQSLPYSLIREGTDYGK